MRPWLRAAVNLNPAADREGRDGLDHCASCRKIVQEPAVADPSERNEHRQGDFGSEPGPLLSFLNVKRIAGAITAA
jgi:hypothetical protein